MLVATLGIRKKIRNWFTKEIKQKTKIATVNTEKKTETVAMNMFFYF